MNNTILSTLSAAGASRETAAQDHLAPGVAASHTMARTDLPHLLPLKPCFEAASAAAGLPPALLAAIASRETRGGALLDADGFGDGKRAFGIMQVDRRYHALAGVPDPKSRDHIHQATGILAASLARIASRFPHASQARQLQAAVAAYNCGVGGVGSIATVDERTTGRDYSNDVWARAAFYAADW